MSAVLDYDALEMLGAAIREARRDELDEPLNDKLQSLCRQLGADEGQGPEGAAPAPKRGSQS